MTTANIKITKVLLGRGNTAISANYTGVMGEVTMDTTLKTLRVHDGNIAGGTRLATYQEVQDVATGNLDLSGYATTAQITAANASINSFKTYANVTFSTVANAASQQTQINSINANVLAANAAITALQSNAALQASLINTLTSNAATQGGALNDLVTNAAAQTQSLTILTANAATQANSLTDLIANAAAQAQQIANVSGTYGNANVAAYLPTYTGNVRAGNINFNNGSRVQALNNNINLLANSNGAVELKSHGGNYIWGFDNFGFTILPETDPAYAPVANSSVLFAPTALAFKAGLTHLIFHANGLLDIPNGILMNNGSTLTSGSLNAGAGGSAILSTNDGHNQVYTEDFDAGASAGIWIQTSTDGNTYSNWVFQANGNLSAGGNLIPSANVTYSLGSSTNQWRDLWVSNNTIYIGGTPVRVASGSLLVNNVPVSSTVANLTNGNSQVRLFGNGALTLPPSTFSQAPPYGVQSSIQFLGNGAPGTFVKTITETATDLELFIDDGSGSTSWTFDGTGNLKLPFDSNIIFGYAGTGMQHYRIGTEGVYYARDMVITTANTNANTYSTWRFGSNGNVIMPGNIHSSQPGGITIASNYDVRIIADHTDNNRTWTFDGAAGELILPGGNVLIDPSDGNFEVRGAQAVNFEANTVVNIYTDTSNNGYQWQFGDNGALTFPTSGNLIFDSSAVSVIDGITNISAIGTVGANVIQVLSDLTSFGASPAPRIYGFSSIATTGSAVNEGNISASGNLVASQNAYVTGNVFAAQYNYANGVSISQSIQNGISNVRVLSSGGLVSINVGGASNIALFTTTGASIGGTLSTSGLTATGAVTLATASGNINLGASQTTGHVNMGGTAQTGTILIGQSTYPQTINIGHGVTGSGNTKTIQIGENGAAGSTTLIDIGPATASAVGTVTFNTATVVNIANTGGSALSVAGSLTVTGNITQQSAYYETYANVTNSGGNLTCNFVNGGTFYATLTANVTANFTNVALTTGTIIGATIIVDQGATPYQISNVQVNGGGIQTVKWAGGVGQNPGTGSNTDVMSFSLINLGGGAWRVLGAISNYG